MDTFRRNRLWLLAAVLVTLASLGSMFGPQIAAAGNGPDGGNPKDLIRSPFLRFDIDRQIFNEDLVVESGQTINENVAVFNGNAEVRDGGLIRGNLSVFRGDVVIGGRIEGNLAAMGGDVRLQSSAHISGDVSVFGGDVRRDPGAYVGGNFLGGGQRVPAPLVPEIELVPGVRTFSAPSLADRIVGFMLRLIQAVLWTLLVTGLVVLVMLLAPQVVESTAEIATADPALSFISGLLIVLAVVFLAFLLAATICLAPVAALLVVLAAVAGLLGWAVTSFLVGRRLTQLLSMELQPLLMIGIGALVLSGVTGFFWAISQCLGWLVALLLGSTGTGALIVNQIRARRPGGQLPGAGSAPEGDEGEWDGGPGPSGPQTSPEGAQVDDGVPGLGTPGSSAESTEAPARSAGAAELGLPDAAVERARRLAEPGAEVLEESSPESHPDDWAEAASGLAEADFTQIKGIGPTFDQRLKAANVRTFAALAAMTAEQAADILGWSPDRIERDRIIEQARDLAR